VKLSVCVITKNEEQFLQAAMESWMDYADEVIVVDDQSVDGTLEIASSFPKVRIIEGQFNGDKARQRQVYLDEAQGDWIFCADGDEVYPPELMRWAMEQMRRDDIWTLRADFWHYWKDFIHVMEGDVYEQFLQRFYRNLPGLNYRTTHHSVAMADGKLLAKVAKQQQREAYAGPEMRVHHYSYCKQAAAIRRKIEYYMRRDNPNCQTAEQVRQYVGRHPYFSGDFAQPRYGVGGLYCCGSYKNKHDKLCRRDEEHPGPIRKHPLYGLYYVHALRANRYMEEHWQFNNHLDMVHHQGRFEETAKHCLGKTLEVGCANGDSCHYLKRANPLAKFYGVEATDWGYRNARRNYPQRTFYQDYAENLSAADKSFDTVLLSEIIEHVVDPMPVLDEAFRVARKRVVVTTPAQDHPDPDHKRVITIPEMRELLLGHWARDVAISGLTWAGPGKPVEVAQREVDIHFQIARADL